MVVTQFAGGAATAGCALTECPDLRPQARVPAPHLANFSVRLGPVDALRLERERTHALAGGGENSVGEGRNHGRQRRFAQGLSANYPTSGTRHRFPVAPA